MLTFILAVVSSVLLLVADQFTKLLVLENFTLGETKVFIKGLLNFCYVENDGGAWGMLGGYTWLLLAITAVTMIACIMWLIVKGRKNPFLFWAVSLIISGGIGNMLDRIFRAGRVVDFLQFGFWQSFPVFNIADCAIVIGSGLLILYFVLDTVKELKAKKENSSNGDS